jgi:hypothetical protein
MKSLKEYLMEDVKQFTYRIKIAGELAPEVLDNIKQRLARYDTISVTDPKKTPIQKSPAGFNGIENQEVNIIDFTFQYPASLDEIRQQVFQAGIPLNNVMVINAVWDDSNTVEEEAIAKTLETSEEDSLLNTFDWGRPTAEAKKLSKEYAGSNMKMAKDATNKQGFKVAGGTTPKAKTTNDLPQNNVSTLTNGNRNVKPTAKNAAQ